MRKCENKIKAIIDAPTPQNVTQVKSFAGMVNYYLKFFSNISLIMRPIYDLLKKVNTYFHWSKNCQLAFDKI